jgi:hypothetical protein
MVGGGYNEVSSSPHQINTGDDLESPPRVRLRYLETVACQEVSCYPLLSINRAMEQAGLRSLVNHQNKAEIFFAKTVSRLRCVWNVGRSPSGPVFAPFMGSSEYKILPFACWTEVVPYCFDCWPDLYGRWASFFRRHRIRIAFFSARASAQYFSDRIPSMKSVWLPEATDPLEYRPTKSWLEKDIDVLELGRRDHAFHDKIAESLATAQRSHLFERIAGQIIFPDRNSFIEGLSRTRISICFPSSQTHPGRSGSVETVTHRYFESMASKCLIVGHAPKELVDLFGYNPVIEVQEGQEFRQIETLLNNPEDMHALVDRNYRRLLEVGTWKCRVATILDILGTFPF